MDINLRALTDKEIKRLEQALVEPIDRKYLVHWVLQATGDVVRLSTLPRLGVVRDDVLKLARDGRHWLQTIEKCAGKDLLRDHAELDQLVVMMERLCGEAEAIATRLGTAVGSGHPSTAFALEGFLDRMIGIAKMAKVFPSTPGRALRSQTAPRCPPAFFVFVGQALEVAIDVIKSSPLSRDQKEAAVTILASQSDNALSKLLERLRGKIGDYREGAHGLVEGWGD
jgi:hypothetical protein